jgi:hypothetical protein
MIQPPPNWRQDSGVNLVTLYPPEGGGRVRFYPRLAVRRASELVDDVVGREAALAHPRVTRSERLITDEGEHALWLEVRGDRRGVGDLHFVGVVLTDDFAAVLDTRVDVIERRTYLERCTHDMLLGLRFGMGQRRRRYWYRPPEGWYALPQGSLATWYPPDYPRHCANIAVFPAEPSDEPPHTVFDAELAHEEERGLIVNGPVTAARLVGQSGLEGFRWSVTGRGPGPAGVVVRETIVLVGNGHHYRMRLESRTPGELASDRRTLIALADSIEPVPYPGARSRAAARGALLCIAGNWAD